MAYYSQITETLWITEPRNFRERCYLIYLQLRGKVGTIRVQNEDGSSRKVWLMSPKCVAEFKKSLKLRTEI